jgi:hypothetical protein
MFLSVIVPPGLSVAGHAALMSAPLSGHHDRYSDEQLDAGRGEEPSLCGACSQGVITTLEAGFFVRSAAYPASSGGHVDQRQHDADDAGDDEDQADRRT